MSVRIRKIEIRNYRSTRNLTLKPESLAILVGKNDSGKSNVLRALNLFFNEKTDLKESLNFSIDHNIYNEPNRRAKEIWISIELEIPANYHRVNGDFIVWEKRWRAEGCVYDKYTGRRKIKGKRGGISLEEVTIPDRSNLHSLLRNIVFVYVPAIKDPEYFSELRASIYDVIAEVADKDFRNSSRNFEGSISLQLQDLTNQITASLGFNSRLALPNDLSHIFEKLDFLSETQNISLDARGDGVKARHIPLILKFMADKKQGLQGRGAPPYTYIWGYEEPENSLELSNSVELADQFWSFVKRGVSQIFLTTHSPVFYNLHRKQEGGDKTISCHHMFMAKQEEGTQTATELHELDDRMGATALFAPMIADLEDDVRRQEQARQEVEDLAKANRRKLFVEGPSDRLIMKKAFEVFAPEYASEIDVETKTGGAGHNYVIDMLASWRSKAKHHQELPKAAGLLDLDPEARKAVNDWNRVNENVISAKCFKLPTPPHIRPILAAGFCLPVVLESLYDRDIWTWAEQHGHLKYRKILEVIPADLGDDILKGQTHLDDHLPEEWSIYVKYQFLNESKIAVARHLSKKEDAEFRERFQFIEELVSSIVSYLFPNG